MAFRLTFLGRPATAQDLMNLIHDELVAAGWTSLYNAADRKALQCASYLMPDGTEAGKAVVEIINPATTNHVHLRMHQDWDAVNNVGIGPSTSERRISYSMVSTVNYRIYANEYWFMLINVSSTNAIGNALHHTYCGLLLPPPGIPTKPTYKAVFVGTVYNSAGTSQGNLNFVSAESTSTRAYFGILPDTGEEGRIINFTGGSYGRVYRGHADKPSVLFPVYPVELTSYQTLGWLIYGLGTTDATVPQDIEMTSGTETWRNVNAATNYVGQLWYRIS